MGPEDLRRLIRDLMEPCICPGRGGHTNPACPWYDLPDRAVAQSARRYRRPAGLLARAARQAAIARQAAA